MNAREKALAWMEAIEQRAWLAYMRGDAGELVALRAAVAQARLAYEWHCRPAGPDAREASEAA